jgi:hypothetical protein
LPTATLRIPGSFCERYNAHPPHSMGAFPFETAFDFQNGWRTL